MFSFQASTRIRPSPFFEAAVAEGLKTANVYNRMIMPTSYGDPEGEYWRLINGVSQWDVGVERQVQLKGPDAARLAQILAVRDMSTCGGCQDRRHPLEREAYERQDRARERLLSTPPA